MNESISEQTNPGEGVSTDQTIGGAAEQNGHAGPGHHYRVEDGLYIGVCKDLDGFGFSIDLIEADEAISGILADPALKDQYRWLYKFRDWVADKIKPPAPLRPGFVRALMNNLRVEVLAEKKRQDGLLHSTVRSLNSTDSTPEPES